MKNGSIWHKIENLKKDDAGSAIVTVLVVVAFMTILTTIMLYVSSSNFQMKAADYRTKESFYRAETPVEELRAQLVEDVQVAFAKAYAETIAEYAGLQDPELIRNTYRSRFRDEMNTLWRTRSGFDTDNKIQWETGISGVVSQPPTGEGSWTLTSIAPSLGLDETEFAATDKGWLILRGVEFTYVSPLGYTSIISTDFCIEVPEVQWPNGPDSDGNFSYAPRATSKPIRLDFSDCVSYMNWTKK